MKFIQVRGSGDIFYWTPALAERDDVDEIEAPDSFNPDQVKESLERARANIKREADLAAAEAEKLGGIKVAKRAKITAIPEGLTVTKVEADGGQSE